MTYAAMPLIEMTQADLASVERPLSFSALDAAVLLHMASPQSARRFALSMHERAVWGLDVDLIEHWAEVVVELRRMTG